jgi:MFS family permease
MRFSAVATAAAAAPVLLFLFAESKNVAYLGLGFSILLVGFHYGPCYALTQTLVRLRMRSVASSIIYLGISLLGLGCGPLVVGLLNDALAATYGGQAVRYSLIVSAVAALAGAACFLGANRYVEQDLARVDDLQGQTALAS